MPTCQKCGYNQNIGEFTNGLCGECQRRKLQEQELVRNTVLKICFCEACREETLYIGEYCGKCQPSSYNDILRFLEQQFRQNQGIRQQYTWYIEREKTLLEKEIKIIREVLNE